MVLWLCSINLKFATPAAAFPFELALELALELASIEMCSLQQQSVSDSLS